MTKIKKSTNNQLTETHILNNEEIALGVFHLSVKRCHDFIPGQVVKISLSKSIPPRIYSICSGNTEKELRILFNIKEDGLLSPKLAGLIPGDTILISKPYGSFTSDSSPAYCIATGTGIAPFYSMFQSGHFNKKILIHGSRYLNQFYFEDDFSWKLDSKYIRCCSKEISCDVFSGRVTDYINTLQELPLNHKYYLCGRDQMVVEVRDILIAKGIPFKNILSEIYF